MNLHGRNDDNPYTYMEYGDGKKISPQLPLEEIQVDGLHLKLMPEKHFTTKTLVLPMMVQIPLSFVLGGTIGAFGTSFFICLGTVLAGETNSSLLGTALFVLLLSFVFLLPVIIAPMIYFSPWILVLNYWTRSLVSRFHLKPLQQNQYICQFTTSPRYYRGIKHCLRARIEDADDIGVLSLLEDRIVFQGDHTFFSLSRDEILLLKRKIASLARSAGMGGYYIRIYSDLLSEHGYKYVQIGERQSKTIFETYRLGRKIHAEIGADIKKESRGPAEDKETVDGEPKW